MSNLPMGRSRSTTILIELRVRRHGPETHPRAARARDVIEPHRGRAHSQGFALAQKWPGNATAGANMPNTCLETPQATALQQFCPTPGTLAAANGSPATANFANVDALANVTWTTRVRDNGKPETAGAPDLSVSYVAGAADNSQKGKNAKGDDYTCTGPCKMGRQRRSTAVGRGEGHRARQAAQSRRAAQARALRRGLPAQRRRRGELRDLQQRQQDDHRRDRLAGRRTLPGVRSELHRVRGRQVQAARSGPRRSCTTQRTRGR